MQTFLPYPSFDHSARCLDRLRLGKQRIEAKQILSTCLGISSGWRNHPAVVMWKGYEIELIYYGLAVCNEWSRRGYVDNTAAEIHSLLYRARFEFCIPHRTPHWLHNRAFHLSHRSNLLRKDSKWYGRFNWNVSNDLPYVWPKPLELV